MLRSACEDETDGRAASARRRAVLGKPSVQVCPYARCEAACHRRAALISVRGGMPSASCTHSVAQTVIYTYR